MKLAKEKNRKLAALASVLSGMPNIWRANSVASEPQKWLANWQGYKTVKANIQPELFGYHFVGYDVQGDMELSPADRFDPMKIKGITLSGRIYQLVGMPGADRMLCIL